MKLIGKIDLFYFQANKGDSCLTGLQIGRMDSI